MMMIDGATAADLSVIYGGAEQKTSDFAKIVESLACAVDVRDSHTAQHLYRSSMLASACLEQIDYDLSLDEDTGFGFLLHDVGKIGIPDSILSKPGPLEADEWLVMQQHPEMGVRIVEPIGFGSRTIDVIRHHHERWDGLGYPNKIAGTDIPLAARVFSVADTYDALTTDRPYRNALSKKVALQTIAADAGTRLDPHVVATFIAMVA